jgi:SAM-dependent methyltransferase
MTDFRDWTGRTGESWAAEWRRTDRSFGGLTERLLQRSREFAFDSVLDIGCGAGELSLALARGRPRTEVVGVDISPQLVEAARERGANLANVRFELGDAAQWTPPDNFRPEQLVSRHGVMFFDNPVAAFAHLAEIAAPAAGLLFSCFRGASENEIFTGIGKLLPPPERPPDPHAPGPMAFADPERVRAILSEAGWGKISFEPFDFAMVAGVGEDAVSDAVEYFKLIGPAAAAMAELPQNERDEIVARMRTYLETREIEGMVALGAAAWIVTARRA